MRPWARPLSRPTVVVGTTVIMVHSASVRAAEPDDDDLRWTTPRFGELVGLEEPPSPEPPPEEERSTAPADLNFSAYLGGFGSNLGGGPMLGMATTWRNGWLQLGVAVEAGGSLFEYGIVGSGALAGIGWRSPRWQIDLLAAGGLHSYSQYGAGWSGDDPGATALLPFAGLRAGIGYAFGENRSHFVLGVVALGETDLRAKRVEYDYVEHGWFGGDGTLKHVDTTVWTNRLGVALRLGATLDLP